MREFASALPDLWRACFCDTESRFFVPPGSSLSCSHAALSRPSPCSCGAADVEFDFGSGENREEELSLRRSRRRAAAETAQASLSNPAAFAASPAPVAERVASMVCTHPSAESSRMMIQGTSWGGEKPLHNPVRTGIRRTSLRMSGLRFSKGESAVILQKTLQTFPTQTGRYHLENFKSRVNSPIILLPAIVTRMDAVNIACLCESLRNSRDATCAVFLTQDVFGSA